MSKAEAHPAQAKRPAGRGAKIPVDLLGGRFFHAALCLLLITPMASAKGNQLADDAVRKVYEWAGSPLDDRPPDTSKWQPGATEFVTITLVTEDESRLTCASDELVDQQLHCALKTDKHPWPRDTNAPIDDNKERIIQPYRTLEGNELILISGVWAQPEIAMRAHQEPAGVVPVNRQSRFVAYCRVRFHAQFEKVGVRWFPGGQWFDEKASVAEAERCATHDFRRTKSDSDDS